MSVSLITWGRWSFQRPDGTWGRRTVPAPSTNPGYPWLWDFVASQSTDLAKHFDAIQLPGASKCLGGAGEEVDGYGVFDQRDLGSKPQQGSIPTRYGTKDSLLRLIAVAHANGMNVWLDIPLHQLMGENGGPGVFKYLGADHKTLNGRGQTTPGWFRGNTSPAHDDPVPPFCPEDDVPSVYYDFAFGREKSYQHSNPPGVTIEDAKDFGDWLFRTTDADGGRFDDVKGTWEQFVADFMYARAMASKPFYSEYFDNDGASLWWAESSPVSGRSGVEDFDVHFAIQTACNYFTVWPLNRALMRRSDLSYPFVENPDTDTSYGQQVVSSKLLGYAYACTIPCRQLLVYGKDYFGDSVWPGAYGLKPYIDNLCWIQRVLAFGAFSIPYTSPDGKVIVFQRNGDGGSVGTSPGLLTCLNFDTWNSRTVTCPTTFWPGTHLHDFTGHHGDIWCDGEGRATFTIPSNAFGNGRSYLCFSWAGVEGKTVRIVSRSTRQTFFGADDLDIPAAAPDAVTPVQRIWCEEDTQISITYSAPGAPNLVFSVVGPDGMALDLVLSPGLFQTVHRGWHQVSVQNLNATDAVPYEAQVEYTAPQALIPGGDF